MTCLFGFELFVTGVGAIHGSQLIFKAVKVDSKSCIWELAGRYSIAAAQTAPGSTST